MPPAKTRAKTPATSPARSPRAPRPAATPARVKKAASTPAKARARAAAARNGTGRAPLTPAPAHAGPRVEAVPAMDYAPAPESLKVAVADRYGLFIGGEFVEPTRDASADDGAATHFETINPATQERLSLVAQASGADVDRAVRAAREALPGWQALGGLARGKLLFRLARRIQERARELAVLETLDGGKPIRESRDLDVPLAAQHFFYHAGWADKLEYVPGVRRRGGGGGGGRGGGGGAGGPPEPVGVCGQIIPWNFPLLMAAWKLAPALACGNTCVLKPAETTPLTALRLAEICREVGLPPGVVNIVTGDGRVGAALAAHPGVDKLAFTGSTEVGKVLARQAALRGTRLTLELGGKSAHIIFEDASLDQAIEGVIQGIYANQGHVCCAGSRLLVQEGVEEAVIRKLTRRLASLRVGDPMDKNTDVGAINSRAQLERIERFIRAGRDEGATLHQVGRGTLPARGFFCRPCFFSGVQPGHTIARDEIFGPVLSILTFRTADEAVARANNSPYGLAAGVWSDKGGRILDVARRLEAGVVWLNTYHRFDAASPFGGFKESGFGREGGIQGLRAYLA